MTENFIFGYGLIDYTPTATSENSNYPVANVKDYAHLRRHYRSAVQTEVAILLDFGSDKTVQVILVDDVNFTNVFIQGNATNVWTSPSFNQQYAISKDDATQRYKLCAVLTGFDYRYLRIRIPAQTPADGLSVFRIGRAVCVDSKLELSQNPSYPYKYGASYPEPLEVTFPSGGYEQVEMGDYKIWEGEFSFDAIDKASESQLWLLDSLSPTDYMIFFENRGDTSKGYMCKKKAQLAIEWTTPKMIKTNTFVLKEAI